MSDIKRYSPAVAYDHAMIHAACFPSPDGKYVEYTDYDREISEADTILTALNIENGVLQKILELVEDQRDKVETVIEALKKELAEYKKDAERYRWMQSDGNLIDERVGDGLAGNSTEKRT